MSREAHGLLSVGFFRLHPSARLTGLKITLPLLAIALLIAAAPPEKAAPEKPKEAKIVELAKNVQLEVLPTGERRVIINGEVSFREGAIELLMCRKYSKEHESLVTADV